MATGGKFLEFSNIGSPSGNGKTMVFADARPLDIKEVAEVEAMKEHNLELQKEYDRRKTERLKQDAAKAAKIEEQFNDFEIMPLMGNVLVRPYSKNPFEKFEVSELGIITKASFDGSFDNPDTGTRDKQDNAIVFADVIEVGPEVKNIQTGDIIMFRNHSQLPVPFFGEGFYVTHQNNVLVAINKGLTERVKLNK